VPITGDRESNDGLAKEEAPPDDEVSAQTAPNDREVLDPLALLLPAAQPSPFGRANDEIWYFSDGANMR
jgi:hypothetical protein